MMTTKITEDSLYKILIKTRADFKNFIVDIENGIDKFEEPRKEVNKLVNTFNDGKQCERVLALSKIE